MIAGSLFGTYGLSIKICDSDWNTWDDLTTNIETYSHEIISQGGFWKLGLSFKADKETATKYYMEGIAKRILVLDHDFQVFRGTINIVTVSDGINQSSVGPLFDIANRASATYTTTDYEVYPPVTGSEETTLIAENLASQQKYGIIEKMINVGTIAKGLTANYILDVFLEENHEPVSTGDLNISPNVSVGLWEITLEIVGMVNWLYAYIYNETEPVDYFEFLSEKIKTILTADPNSVFSSNYSHITENDYSVNMLEDKNRFAYDIISELLKIGDYNYRPLNFGIYEDDLAYFEFPSYEIKYIYRISDPRQVVIDAKSLQVVAPWAVRPGYFIFVPDYLPLADLPTDLYTDRRVKFIKSVTYTAPYTLSIQSGRMDKLSGILAKISYSGGYW